MTCVHIKKRDGQKIFTGILMILGCLYFVRVLWVYDILDKEETHYPLSYYATLAVKEDILSTYMPGLLYVTKPNEKNTGESFPEKIMSGFPLYAYMKQISTYQVKTENKDIYEKILESEANDENMIDNDGNVIFSEGALTIEETLTSGFEEENENAKTEETEHLGEFVKAEKKQMTYDAEKLKDFNYLIEQFYAIDKTTGVTPERLNAQAMLAKDMTMQKTENQPQILIYHTHSQEAFVDSIAGDTSTTIVGAGDYLTELLEKEYGFSVLHHTGQYDVESRDNAYSNAEPAITELLKENPSIDIIIDMHRDGIAEDKKLVTTVGGQETAQFMFFNGLSYTNTMGDIDYLYNPYIEDNLAFSFQMQLACNEYYPGLARKIYLKGYRYNMHFKPKTLLLEVGAQTNTVQEIMNAMNPIAHIISVVLNGEQ